MTIRESARLQTFPDSFVFHYSDVEDGYKMVGNAVPVRMAQIIAAAIKEQIESRTCSVVENYNLQVSFGQISKKVIL